MGCSFSCITFRTSSFKSSKLNNSIKVVHFDGRIEHLDPPVTVCEVTGHPSKHLMFTHAQLLTSCSTPPLKYYAPLEPGRVYFLLPCTLFGSNVSPMDLVPITRKLAALTRSKSKSKSSGMTSDSSSVGSASPVWSSPGRSPNRLSSDVRIRMQNDQFLCRSGSWKPILAPISETLNQRSESDLMNDVKVDRI